MIPHEYYGHNGLPEHHEYGNDALTADPSYLANEVPDQLPLHSTMGLGPKGDGVIAKIKESSDINGTFIVQFLDSETEELIDESPNLHAGIITAEADETKHTCIIKLTRNGVAHELCRLDMPEGEHGTRIFLQKAKESIETNEDYVAVIHSKDFFCQGLDVIEPRVYDCVMSNVRDYEDPEKAYVATGYIQSVESTGEDEWDCTVIFNTFFQITGGGGEPIGQVQVDYNETDQSSVRYIKNRDKIQGKIAGSQYVKLDDTNTVYLDNIATDDDIHNLFN